MNPMFAMKKGTAMKDKKKRAGGGAPPPPPPSGTFPGATNSAGVADNIFGVIGRDFSTVQANIDVASMTIMDIVDLNTGAQVSPYSGTNIQVADFIARGNSQPGGGAISPAPSIGSGYAGYTLIDGEITLNIANNGSDTGIALGVSAYNPTNQRFGGASRFDLTVHRDTLNLVSNGYLTVSNNFNNNLSNPNGITATTFALDLVLHNPPAVASGELIFEVRGTLQSKRASSPHDTTRPSNILGPPPATQYAGSSYLSVVIN